MLLQIVATAGHFHREDFPIFAAGKATILAANDGLVPAPAQPGGLPALPSHDDCSLCFSLQLAGASALPAPMVLAAPAVHRVTPPSPETALRLTAAPHLLFQTRAPPIA